MSQSIISKTLSRTLSAPNLCNTDHSPSKRDTKMPFWKPTKSSSSSQAASDGLVDGVARQTSSASSKGKAKESSSRISKPFNTMSVEEMLDVLPSCNSEVITSAWLPQVKRDWDRIKADLEKMYNEKLRSQVTLADFKDVSRHIYISRTYSLTTFSISAPSVEALVPSLRPIRMRCDLQRVLQSANIRMPKKSSSSFARKSKTPTRRSMVFILQSK